MVKWLKRMNHITKIENNKIKVTINALRPDVLHIWDLA